MAGFNWRPSLYAVILALAVFLPLLLSQAFDLAIMIYLCVLLPALTLILALFLGIVWISKKRAPGKSILLMVVIYWAVSAALYVNSESLRAQLKWFLRAKESKSQVLANPSKAPGELRHAEWDEWGMFGMDTKVYLVFDPTDSLSLAAARHSTGKIQGIPCCIVASIRRLDSQWYSVKLYTGSVWEN
jgi:hypothetical protein